MAGVGCCTCLVALEADWMHFPPVRETETPSYTYPARPTEVSAVYRLDTCPRRPGR
ncbi:hypothetical protein DAEQUDRAFT_723976 [Daedalea quercina L-15889]|uniref:Uncharacterized protein n=1 Tax=Daedalea quercina L-15889 TaxID=1314783 RepID=A0A165S302_9APHY|nr:hypothetical protein DAEQUDRAFT_723976 [Daedalea quercina L-15889]